ncbi:HipA domain-containing protein [Edaphobacter bradus]|uniref:HipA domain-containing protein n=1 Tax=Edaphobacter bradus TaxID=2259016 RepID=UPI0021E036C8|nr:HipA domain-containing protein [Edaphobacter bradus]
MTKKEMMSPYRQGLPTRFVRVGRRGATWGLPRRFQGYQASGEHVMSMAGAATKCFLSKDGSPEGAYIAKFAHKNGHIETYTELFNNQLGMLLGFGMAHSGIAKLDESLHFVSRSFRTDPADQLLHGSLLVQEIGLADQFELERINTASRQQGIYDIDFVRDMIYQVCDKYADTVFASLVEMLVFDALTGAMDRHPRNWGVLRTATLPAEYKFAPLYDSARALLWDKTDDSLEILESNEGDFQRYVLKSHPRIGLPKSVGQKGKCTHVDLIRYLLSQHKEVTLRAYTKIRVDIERTAGHLLRQHPFRRVFTKRRARLIVRLLLVRQQALEHLIKEGNNA